MTDTQNQQNRPLDDEQQTQFQNIPENPIELAKDIFTPDLTHSREKSNYHKNTIFKELNLAKYDRLDQRIVLDYQVIEETLISWGLKESARLFNAEKQSYVMSTRSLDGFERKSMTTQRLEQTTNMAPDREGLLGRLQTKRQDEGQQQGQGGY